MNTNNEPDMYEAGDILVVNIKNDRDKVTGKAYSWPVDDQLFVLVAWKTGEICSYIDTLEAE